MWCIGRHSGTAVVLMPYNARDPDLFLTTVADSTEFASSPCDMRGPSLEMLPDIVALGLWGEEWRGKRGRERGEGRKVSREPDSLKEWLRTSTTTFKRSLGTYMDRNGLDGYGSSSDRHLVQHESVVTKGMFPSCMTMTLITIKNKITYLNILFSGDWWFREWCRAGGISCGWHNADSGDTPSIWMFSSGLITESRARTRRQMCLSYSYLHHIQQIQPNGYLVYLSLIYHMLDAKTVDKETDRTICNNQHVESATCVKEITKHHLDIDRKLQGFELSEPYFIGQA